MMSAASIDPQVSSGRNAILQVFIPQREVRGAVVCVHPTLKTMPPLAASQLVSQLRGEES